MRAGGVGSSARGSAAASVTGIDAFHGSDEAIAAAGQGLDESGAAGGVAEGFADAVDGGVDAVLVVDKGAVGPELAGDSRA